MCIPVASPTSVVPINIRKLSARIFSVGCFSTKSPIDLADSIITPTEMTTAMIITGRSRAMPTAVITESREKTMSSSMICTSTPENDGGIFFTPSPSMPSSLW